MSNENVVENKLVSKITEKKRFANTATNVHEKYEINVKIKRAKLSELEVMFRPYIKVLNVVASSENFQSFLMWLCQEDIC